MLKRIMIAFLFLTFFLHNGKSVLASPNLLDRLVVEVSGKSYSQKDLETYILLRTIAMGEGARRGLPSAETWLEHMETFKNEMIIVTQLENDQTKLDSFLPDSKKISEAQKALSDAQSKEREVDTFIRQRGLTDADLSKVLTSILRVEGYARSRMQLTQTRTNDNQGPGFIKLDRESEWFKALQKTVAYRYYLGAKEYKPLTTLR